MHHDGFDKRRVSARWRGERVCVDVPGCVVRTAIGDTLVCPEVPPRFDA